PGALDRARLLGPDRRGGAHLGAVAAPSDHQRTCLRRSRVLDGLPRGPAGLRRSGAVGAVGRLSLMSTINSDEVARLAGLARIDLGPEEIEKLAGELDVIVQAVATVSEVAGDDVPATSHPIPLTNVLREDVVGQTLPVDEVLAQAPAAEDGQFAVPQILGEDA